MDSNASLFRKILAGLLRFLRFLVLLAAAAGILMIARSVINTAVLMSYQRGHFSEIPENLLVYLRFGDNYVAPYNMGNIEYQLGNYDKAVFYYQQALVSKPPERDEECMIRVNLAYSMCHTIDWDNLDREDKEAVQKAMETLATARAFLTEHECASEPVGSDDGHYRDADLLKHDIDRMLEQLSQSQSDGGGGQDEDQSNGSGGQDENQDENQGDGQDEDQSSGQDDSSQKDADGKDAEAERAKQEKLKEDLAKQKQDLKEKSSSYGDYEYIDGGSAQGYGDGTLW